MTLRYAVIQSLSKDDTALQGNKEYDWGQLSKNQTFIAEYSLNNEI